MSAYDEFNDVKHAVINESTAASNELIAAVTDKKIQVLALSLISAAAVNVTLQSASTALSGAMAAANGITLPFNPAGWVETAKGEALNLLLSGAVQVSGVLVYREAGV
jgi:hypothetical protein